MLGAIIIAGEGAESSAIGSAQTPRRPWAHVEVLGRSVIARFADQLKRECDAVYVTPSDRVTTRVRRKFPDGTTDECESASVLLANLRQEGFETVLVARCGAYVEFDPSDMLAFHREGGHGVSRALAPDGPLDLWMIDCGRLSDDEPVLPLLQAEPANYQIFGYVNRLQNAYDFRRLVLDSFSSRCQLRPLGVEVKPGVWICEGAQIERTARLVAPAFIGSQVVVSDDCLITRGSNIESNSLVDFGTAIEDSSVLPKSYVGIGLDLAHSIVDGRNLLNLRHNVGLEITDPVVMRHHAGRGGDRSWADVRHSEMMLSSAD
jgi:hypothetical protein